MIPRRNSALSLGRVAATAATLLFLWSPAAPGAASDLAGELAGEGSWIEARREGLRAVLNQPDDGSARLAAARAGLHVPRARESAQAELEALAASQGPLAPAAAEELALRAGPAASLGRVAGWPGVWIVGFYRSQIRPAIGARCSLHPSCSEYFLQAVKKHGLLGFPLIGDRLVREPGVANDPGRYHEFDGKLRASDPLDEHDRFLGPPGPAGAGRLP